MARVKFVDRTKAQKLDNENATTGSQNISSEQEHTSESDSLPPKRRRTTLRVPPYVMQLLQAAECEEEPHRHSFASQVAAPNNSQLANSEVSAPLAMPARPDCPPKDLKLFLKAYKPDIDRFIKTIQDDMRDVQTWWLTCARRKSWTRPSEEHVDMAASVISRLTRFGLCYRIKPEWLEKIDDLERIRKLAVRCMDVEGGMIAGMLQKMQMGVEED